MVLFSKKKRKAKVEQDPPPPPDPPQPRPPPPEGREAPTLVKRKEWKAKDPLFGEAAIKTPVKHVVFSCDTSTEPCSTREDCVRTVKELQSTHMDQKRLSDVAFNFLVGGDGAIYEGRGWNTVSPMTSKLEQTLGHRIDIGFIGRYRPENIPMTMLRDGLCFVYNNVERHFIARQHRRKVFISALSSV